MPEESTDTSLNASRGKAIRRGHSRGGLGKYLRARGRGRGFGRPAEFGKRLLLEGEGPTGTEEEDKEEVEQREKKYSRRQLGTNADRYVEPDPELNSDGEVEVEPEVDLSSFLQRQKLSDDTPGPLHEPELDDDVDQTLTHIGSRSQNNQHTRKGKIKQIEWDKELDDMSQERAAAEATRELKQRFRSKPDHMRATPVVISSTSRRQAPNHAEAPPLPSENTLELRAPKEKMQDFLDDLLG